MTGNSQVENTKSLMDITLDKLRQIKGKVILIQSLTLKLNMFHILGVPYD